jgi:hypothetical protein
MICWFAFVKRQNTLHTFVKPQNTTSFQHLITISATALTTIQVHHICTLWTFSVVLYVTQLPQEYTALICCNKFSKYKDHLCQSLCLHGLKHRPWSLGHWDCGCESCLRHGCLTFPFCTVLSCVRRGQCNGLITHQKESYQVPEQIKGTLHVRGR